MSVAVAVTVRASVSRVHILIQPTLLYTHLALLQHHVGAAVIVLDEHGGTLSALRQLLDHSVVLHRFDPGPASLRHSDAVEVLRHDTENADKQKKVSHF
jgi:hypothetical protein